MGNICIFAGTREGRRLAERLEGRGARLTVCVATSYGAELMRRHGGARLLTGRMDRAQMEALFREERFDTVIDATHPYADRATESISAACRATGTEYLRLLRSSSANVSDGVFVRDAAACAEYLRDTEGAVLLTTGSKDLPVYCAEPSLRDRLYVRVLPLMASLQACEDCGISPDHVIAMQGPFTEEMNLATLRAVRARYLVTKDTGDAGGYAAKVDAAGKAGARVVIVGRPDQIDGDALEEIAGRLESRFGLAPIPKRIDLAGIGMGGAETRTLALEHALRDADCLIGAKRLLASVDCAGKRVHEAFLPADVARIIREEGECRRFVVLFSGDTGFFSGARGVLEVLKDAEVSVLPGIGALQYFCARIARPWEDVRAISLHGREANLAGEVREHGAVFALLGGDDGARNALSRLMNAGYGNLNVVIGERLGYPEERFTRGTAQQLVPGKYDALSVMLVENPDACKHVLTAGLPDEAFERNETPMTKSEVRAVCLSKLALTRDAVIYDIGSGSGSVSVEAARLITRGRVYAIEMKAGAAALTRRNAARFHLENIEVVEGVAPDALEALPAPTHAFIGGSAGKLRAIVDCLIGKNPKIRIVANAVTLESLSELSALAETFEHSDIAQIAVSKPRRIGDFRLMAAQNPVYVFTMWNGN